MQVLAFIFIFVLTHCIKCFNDSMEKKTNEKPNFITNFSFNIKNAILKHILIPASSEKPKNNIHGTGQRDSQSTIEEKGVIPSRLSDVNVNVRKVFCIPKRKLQQDGTLNMCQQCYYQITLNDRFYPRYHTLVSCDDNAGRSCLAGNGKCVANSINIQILFDNEEIGFEKLAQWSKIRIPLTKSCSCQMKSGSFLDNLLKEHFN